MLVTRSSNPKDPKPNPSPKGTKTSKKPSYKSESNQVRHTGDWSADSKLSAITSGYWEDPFFRFFNATDPSKIRRTSLICRGYYVRFRVCNYFLRKVIRAINEPVQIVSLGCGMDTTYFRLLPELESSILRFYELDFKSVITTKKSIILHNDVLRVMATNKLKLLHCDLRQVASLETALKCSDFDFNKPTLFYSECVVNYLRPPENFQILQWIAENVPNSGWLAYEQCNANDPFGQIMVSHFLRNGCPLLSLLSAQSLDDQLSQLKKANFSSCKVINAWDAFLKIGSDYPPYFPSVAQQEHQFDEYEQLVATCFHYSIRFGMTGSLLLSKKIESLFSKFRNNTALQDALINCSVEQISQSQTLKLKSLPSSCLPKLTAHRSVVIKNGTILTFGGSGENSMRMKHLIASKLEKKQLLSADSLGTINEIEDDDSFCEASELYVNTRIVAENANLYERLHCSAVYVPSSVKYGERADSVIIFGGRRSPMKPCLNDLIELNLENPSMTGEIGKVILTSSMYGKCPPPRWRQGMTLCKKDDSSHLLLFGGKTTETVLGDCWWYSVEDFSWTERIVDSLNSTKHSEPSPRHSHVMLSDVDGNEIYMVGGMSENDSSLCEDAFWIYDVSKDSWTLIQEWSPLVRRMGHAAVKHHNFIIVVGGYGADSSYALDFFAAVIDLDSYSVKIFNQSQLSQPRDELFLPFGFTACVVHEPEEDTHKLLVFGGGGNCFSFGTHYNQIAYSITLNLILRN